MPIYEYECQACGHAFEQLVRLPGPDADNAPACPSCRSSDLQRMRSAFAVSSAATKQVHRAQGRKLAQKSLQEQKHAEMEAVVHHHRDHDS